MFLCITGHHNFNYVRPIQPSWDLSNARHCALCSLHGELIWELKSQRSAGSVKSQGRLISKCGKIIVKFCGNVVHNEWQRNKFKMKRSKSFSFPALTFNKLLVWHTSGRGRLRHINDGANAPWINRGRRFLQELRGEVRKLFMHFPHKFLQ